MLGHGCNLFLGVVLWPAHSQGEFDVWRWVETEVVRECSARCLSQGLEEVFPAGLGAAISQLNILSEFVLGLGFAYDVIAIYWFCLLNMMESLVPPTRLWNCSPLPRELLFFIFQICLGSADSHTLVYFFCVIIYGICTKWESYKNEFHSITFIKKQITQFRVPKVLEFIDIILFQYSLVQHFLK